MMLGMFPLHTRVDRCITRDLDYSSGGQIFILSNNKIFCMISWFFSVWYPTIVYYNAELNEPYHKLVNHI